MTLELLKKLVAIPSFYPEEHAISDFIADYLLRIGCKLDRICTGTDRYNLVATIGEASRYLGFYGHIDTVPPASDFDSDPFKIFIDGDSAKALGVCDMKAGIACILLAMDYAVSKQLPVKAFFGVDRENISRGAHDLVKSSLMDNLDFLMVPETGHVTDFNEAFSVCYGRCGRLIYEIEFEGRTVHAMVQEQGENAIVLAADFFKSIQTIGLAEHELLGKTFIVPSSVHSQSDVYSIPSSCKIRLTVMTTPAVAKGEFERWVEKYAEDHDLSVRLRLAKKATPYPEAYAIDLNSKFLGILEQQLIAPYGVIPRYTRSDSDENIFAKKLDVPVLTLGPMGGDFHSKDEWVSIKSLETVSKLYCEAIDLHHEYSKENIVAQESAVSMSGNL